MSPKRRKSVGTTGPVHVTSEGAKFLKLPFPESKDEIEHFIVRVFAKGALPGGLQLLGLKQNCENDFDFTIDTNEGMKYLELMEIAPLENLRGSYAAAPNSYKPYDFAEYIHSKLMRKSDRYAGAKSSNIALLLYVTDWAFILSETVIALLQYWLVTKAHSFQYVFVFHPIDQETGIPHLLYPTPREFWASFNADAFRENVVINLSPLEWRSAPNAG